MNEREPSSPAGSAPAARPARLEGIPDHSLEGEALVLNPGSVLFAADQPLRLRLVMDGRPRVFRLVRSGPGADGRMNLVLQPEAGPRN